MGKIKKTKPKMKFFTLVALVGFTAAIKIMDAPVCAEGDAKCAAAAKKALAEPTAEEAAAAAAAKKALAEPCAADDAKCLAAAKKALAEPTAEEKAAAAKKAAALAQADPVCAA